MNTLSTLTPMDVQAHPSDHAQYPSRVMQAWHFVRHFLEMCVAMCVGGTVLNAATFWTAAQIGYPHLRHQVPELALLLVAANYTLPMVAWMWFRGMSWRPNLEMAGVALGVALLLIWMAGLGIVPRSSLSELGLRFCGVACPLMIVAMLFRLDLYAGRAGHHAHTA